MNSPIEPKRFTRFYVTEPEDLQKLRACLCDEYFRLDEVQWDKSRGVVEIPFQRLGHDGPRRVMKNRFFYRIEEMDVLRGLLRIHEVLHYESEDRAHTGSHAFNRFQYEDARHCFVIQGVPDIKLFMQVLRLQVEYEELEYRDKAKITSGIFWNSDSGVSTET